MGPKPYLPRKSSQKKASPKVKKPSVKKAAIKKSMSHVKDYAEHGVPYGLILEEHIYLKSEESKAFKHSAMFIDLILTPQDAECVIGDLLEQYNIRFELNEKHAIRWIILQTMWITLDRALDLVRKIAKSRAGK